jgi:hypothetical protein
MSKTKYEIIGQDFYINGKPTYSEIPGVNPKALGLLFNSRMIQGIFNDINPANAGKYDRFGKIFDPDENTLGLIKVLPEWYRCGLRAFTVGIQGGGPIYSYEDWGVINTGAFSSDGRHIDERCWERLTSLIKAADDIGMLVIVSYFYQAQLQYFKDDAAILEAAKTATKKLCELEYDNIIIEVANEYDTLQMHAPGTALYRHENMASLIRKVREWCGGRFAVGSSNGYRADKRVIEASDVSIIHGNMKRRQELHDFARKIREWGPDKPIVVNEDSPLFTQLDVAIEDHFSWGYYNTMTKQEPPCDWGITKGEDEYFACRMASVIGIKMPDIPEDSVYLQGFEPHMTIDGGRYIRLASKHPEQIDRVYFYEDGELVDTSYAEPFMVYGEMTWIQKPYYPKAGAKEFAAEVHRLDGRIIRLTQSLENLTA